MKRNYPNNLCEEEQSSTIPQQKGTTVHEQDSNIPQEETHVRHNNDQIDKPESDETESDKPDSDETESRNDQEETNKAKNLSLASQHSPSPTE